MENFSKKIKELFTQYKDFPDNDNSLKIEFLKYISKIIECDDVHIMDNDQLDDLKTDFYKCMEGLE